MTSSRSISSNRSLWNSIALLMVVAFAWQAYAGEVAPTDNGRGEGTAQRLNSRAVVDRVARVMIRKAERQRENPAALGPRAHRANRARGVVRAPRAEIVRARMLCERLLDLPPPLAA